MTDILLVRHGQSEWNAQGRWQGQADPPLSELGRRQAIAAGAYVARTDRFDAIACSTLDRAYTTARLIAEQCAMVEPFATEHLIERSAGAWSGLTREEIERDYPGFLKAKKYPEGYEYDDELLVRVNRGLAEIVSDLDGDRLLVVAHGGIVYAIEQSLGLPFRHLSNVGARWLHRDDHGGLQLGARIDLLVDFDGESTTPTAI